MIKNFYDPADFAKPEALATDFLVLRHQEFLSYQSPHQQAALLACSAYYFIQQQHAHQITSNDSYSPWQQLVGWRCCGNNDTSLLVKLNEQTHQLVLQAHGERFTWQDNAQHGEFRFSQQQGLFIYQDDRQRLSFNVTFDSHGIQLSHDGFVWQCSLVEPYKQSQQNSQSHKGYRAPMTGRITAVLVEAGQAVQKGDTLVVMEAMKMEHRIVAQSDFTIEEIWVGASDLVQDGQVLLN